MTFLRARTLDRALFERSAALPPSPADPVLRVLTRSADHSVLWLGCAAVAAAAGGTARRGAVRAVLSVAVASAVANGVAKPLLPRRRPPARTDPRARRRAVTVPRSSSFPSGHAASAAAFVTGMALESPTAGAVLAPLAAAVAYSRVHTGVHWPSDVLVGAGLGAALAWSTRRWWAVRDHDPAAVHARADAPALPDGDGLLLVVNPGSGSADEIDTALAAQLPRAHRVRLDPDIDVAALLDRLVAEHSPRALGVCGGDGTVVAVATAAARHDLPLAVFPGGTLNHFALDVGAADPDATVAALTGGHAVRVGLGAVTVADRDTTGTLRFVNTASLGGYPDTVRLRERWEPRLGKWPAAAVAMVRVLVTAAPIRATIDGRRTDLWLFFVGNGRYRPSDQVPMSRTDLDPGTLDVRYLRADRPLSRLRLLTAAATGTLGRSAIYVQRHTPAVTVRLDGPAVALATDGEVLADGTDFTVRAGPSALTVYRLPDPAS